MFDKKNLAVYNAFEGQQQQTRRTKQHIGAYHTRLYYLYSTSQKCHGPEVSARSHSLKIGWRKCAKSYNNSVADC